MNKCIIITDIAIWVSGAGHIARLKGLINFLTKHSYVTVVYLGARPVHPVEHLLPNKVNLIILNNDNQMDKEKNVGLLKKMFGFERFKMCFIEYIHNSYCIKAVPEDVVTVLDTHDIISDRNNSFKRFGYPNHSYEISWEREIEIYSLYDYVMFISLKDYTKASLKLNKEQMILAPHSAEKKNHQFRDEPKIVGFIASDYTPNIDSVSWFLERVWSKVPIGSGLEFHIFGGICEAIPKNLSLPNVKLRGFQPDLTSVYSTIDIAINPVRMGSGLKIKNIEAISNGIPLITTSHGASGLENGIGNSFLVADNEDDFLEMLLNLAKNSVLRKQISINAIEWADEKFGEDQCFIELKKILSDISGIV
jgi:glycosyltransferase involved in cell wall biosynthesis